MKLNPYLIFDGRCREAFQFYEKALGGTILAMMPFGETPACEHVPKDHHDRIMHASLEVAGQRLMGSDNTPPHPYEGIKGCSVALNVPRPEEAERLFAALGADATTIIMPMQETFWSPRFGMLVDRFGVPWIINCERGS